MVKLFQNTQDAFKRHGLKIKDVLIHGIGPDSYSRLVRDDNGQVVWGDDVPELEQVPYPSEEAASDIYSTYMKDDLEYMASFGQE